MPLFALFATVALVALVASKGSGGMSATREQGIPPEITAAIDTALRTEHDPANLRAFAAALEPFYPHAAAELRARAAHL